MAKLLSSLPLGSIVKFGKHSIAGETAQHIIWRVADKSHGGYPTGSVTLIARQIIDLRAFDADERATGSSTYGGDNAYHLSNIHQWLNSNAAAGQWYNAVHSQDAPPTGETGYKERPGFLYNFTSSEQSAILPTTLYTQGTSNTAFSAKVFLPSLNEMGVGRSSISDGSSGLNSVNLLCTVTSQVVTYSKSSSKPQNTSSFEQYWTRNSRPSTDYVYAIDDGSDDEESIVSYTPNSDHVGIRPIINLSGNMVVSETTDSDGAYIFSITNAPTAPVNVQITTSPVYTTKPCTVKWGAATDPNGDTVSYRVHTYYDDVEYGDAINVGTATSYSLSAVKSGVSKIEFGIESVDPLGFTSAITKVSATAYTNNIPTISGYDRDLGEKNTNFTQTYTVTDGDNNTVTVTEYLDNVKVRSYVATLGATNTFVIADATWLVLPNGIHTMRITATDGLDEASRTFTFTKSVEKLVVKRTVPMDSSTQPKSIMVTVVKNIPENAIFKVEACNNAYDTNPTWEDMTSRVLQGRIYDFTNSVKTAGKWGVNIRVTVERNGSEGACYITEIGGNFE